MVQVTLDETPLNAPERIVVNRGFIIHKGENNFINLDAESIPDEFTNIAQNDQNEQPVTESAKSPDKRTSTTSTLFESAYEGTSDDELAVISEGNTFHFSFFFRNNLSHLKL